jgi:hypothetical protein
MREIEFNLKVGAPDAPTRYTAIEVRLPFRITGNPTPEDLDMVWQDLEDFACKMLRGLCQKVRGWDARGGAADTAGDGAQPVTPDPAATPVA